MKFIGLDASPEAIAYAHGVGLIDEGLAMDLEASGLPERAQHVVTKADLIVSTGAVGYVGEKTFSRLLGAFPQEQPPWIASFVLRAFDYGPITTALAERGLVTERFEGATFVQRRFRDLEEYESTLNLLRASGVDPVGKEADGLLHAELFVSRPATEVGRMPLSEVVSLSSGGSPRFRHRFRLVTPSGDELAA